MYKQNTDVFLVNELIGNNLTDFIVEGDIYVPENLPDMEKVVYTNGSIKLNNCTAMMNKVSVYGELHYNVLYRGNDEHSTTSSITGKIDFIEEIPVQGSYEGMDVSVTPSIDYIDTKIVSEHKSSLKAVVNINAEVTNSHDVEYVSGIESDDSIQAKTTDFTYTDMSACENSEMTVNDTVILDSNANEIHEILLLHVTPTVAETEIINDRMLIEGVCTVGILYTEKNDEKAIGHITKEIPFSHYIELTNNISNMYNVTLTVNNVRNEIIKDDNDEGKIVEVNIDMAFKLCSYEPIRRTMITDAYSTTNLLDLEKSDVQVTSIVDFCTKEEKYEKTFDVEEASIKDIYYYNAVPKISEKNIYENNMVVDGFIDINVIYLDSDSNKIENASSSLPFSMSIDLSEYETISDIDCDISLCNTGAYRKGISSILFEAKLKNKLTIKNNMKVKTISNIDEGEKLSNKNAPSIIFRVVQPDETLWDIAKDYNISMNYLCKTNNLNIDAPVEVGSKIIITKQV